MSQLPLITRRSRKNLLILILITFGSAVITILLLYTFEDLKSPGLALYKLTSMNNLPQVVITNLNLKTFGNVTSKAILTTTDSAKSPLTTVLSRSSDKYYASGDSDINDSRDNLRILTEKLLREQQELISNEMDEYNFTGAVNSNNSDNSTSAFLNKLIIDKGGEPIRNIIFATWRSGSTFLGDLLNSHPATFYHYEPLLHMKVKQVRSEDETKDAINIVTQLLSCNYTNIDNFNNWQKYESQERNQHNKRIWRHCRKQRKVCEDSHFLSEMCKLFPFQSMKTVRMRLKLASILLESKLTNLRILLLVRDPRGIMQSRYHRDWCTRGSDCIQPDILCNDMEEDFKYAEMLRQRYPDRFLALRYEDISLHPFQAAKKIFTFFHLQFYPDVNYFLQTHTVANHGGVTSTYRDSTKTPFHWKEGLYRDNNTSLLATVQASCYKVMQSWGYVRVRNWTQLLNFSSLGRPPWPEMLVN